MLEPIEYLSVVTLYFAGGSLLAATSAGVSAHCAPPERCVSAIDRRMSLITRLWPALTRLSAIGPPMLPSPINPIRIIGLLYK